MVDFKGNELNVGDKVIVIIGRGVRNLRDGVVTRLTPLKAEVQHNEYNYQNKIYSTKTMKDSHQIYKV